MFGGHLLPAEDVEQNMAAITATQCHHSQIASVMMADTTRTETSMLGPFMVRLREEDYPAPVIHLSFASIDKFTSLGPPRPNRPGRPRAQLVQQAEATDIKPSPRTAELHPPARPRTDASSHKALGVAG